MKTSTGSAYRKGGKTMAHKDFRIPDSEDNQNNAGGNGNGVGGSGMGMPGGFGGLPVGGDEPDLTDIENILINMNEKCAQYQPIKFRERQIMQTLSALCKKEKSNVILIGPAGGGKTAIAEDIARMIANHDPLIPTQLADKTLYELPLSNIVAGCGIVGQLESKVSAIVDFFEDDDNNAILFMDEIHQLAQTRDPSYQKVAQILKPALSRGKIKVIGATTLQEKKEFTKDPALNRRFSEVICPELSREETVEIIAGLKASYSKHHGVVLPDGKEAFLVAVADKNKRPGSHRPDNAITLLDTAMADTMLRHHKLKEDAKAKNDTTLLAALPSVPVLSDSQIETSAKRLLDGKGTALDKSSFTRFQTLMSEKLIGQDDASEEIVDAIKRKTLGVFEDKKPLSFLLSGTTGCGKSHAGKLIAKGILGDEDSVININMTEYSSDMAITRIIGSTDGYVGSDSNHELPFDCLESNPMQVVILDEFEKASRGVQRLFMQALDEGVIKNARGKEIDFSKCIIVATTNAGQEELSKESIGFGASAKKPDPTAALATSFDKELLGRFSHKIQFNSIDKKTYVDILKLKYKEFVEEVNASKQFDVTPLVIEDGSAGDEYMNELADEHYDRALGARSCEKLVRSFIEDKLLDANGYHVSLF